MDGVKEIVIVSFSTVKATTVEGAEKDILQVVIIVIPAEAAQEALPKLKGIVQAEVSPVQEAEGKGKVSSIRLYWLQSSCSALYYIDVLSLLGLTELNIYIIYIKDKYELILVWLKLSYTNTNI